ncbi:hypothetical protein HNQ02_001483 [Flavobacterium sp. 7E]|uniref:hypothetical protein n=1 Tax=unclassified Flavobacterium TaxID=196869 RepID=UPI00156EB2DC|nr:MULTISPECIES: hypothetical protein [unclassified Flavobacterium]MBE0392678.1 hypothetical protein [Flavobacterium sp. PL002]NRS88569.1 hypothetical protein [Flavobacterium sp. 7E]
MKRILLISSFLIMYSCKNNSGYIYDLNKMAPLDGVIVQDISNPINKIKTDATGKFSFSECDNLIIIKKGYETDTLKKYGCKPAGKCFDGHIFYMKKK